MKDEEIIQIIRKGNHDRAVKLLYKEFPKMKVNIINSGGSEQEATETFHDALILLIEKTSDQKFVLTSKLSTYLYGITRLLWKNKLRQKKISQELEWSDTIILTSQDIGYNEEKESRIRQMETALSKLSARCSEIIKRFYYNKESMSAIANAMGFSSTNSAKTQKYKCIEHAISLCESMTIQNAQS